MDIGTILLRSIQTGLVAAFVGMVEAVAALLFVPFVYRHGIVVSREEMTLPHFPSGPVPRDLHTISSVFRIVGPDEAFFRFTKGSRRGKFFTLRGRIQWQASRAVVEQRLDLGLPVFVAAWCIAMAGFAFIGATVRIDIALALTVLGMVGAPLAFWWGVRRSILEMTESLEEVKPFLSRQAV